MSHVTNLKHAAVALAKDWGVDGWRAVDPDVDTLGDNARTLLRRISRAEPPKLWTPAAVMEFLVAHARGQMVYTEGPQRMQGVVERIRPPQWPAHGDCSATVTWAFFVSGWRDPNGLSFNGTGYTGTMLDHGTKVGLADARRNDLVFYDNPQHVGVYVGGGRVISFGHQGGPDNDPVRYRPVWQVRRYPKS